MTGAEIPMNRNDRMDPGTIIRPASVEDLPRIVHLLEDAALPTDGLDASLLPGTSVMTRAGEIIGNASIEMHGQVGLLRSVVIAPEFRNNRYGAGLVRNRIEWAKTNGFASLALFTEHAATFFARLGFRSVKRELMPPALHGSFEFGLCPTTSKSMVLDLTHHGERE